MSGLSLLAMLQSFELAVGGSAAASVVLSLGQCHRGSVTGAVSQWQCHRGSVIGAVSLGQCHRGSVTGAHLWGSVTGAHLWGSATGAHLWPVFSWLERLAFSLLSPVQNLNMTCSAVVRQLVVIRLVAGMLLVPLLGGWGCVCGGGGVLTIFSSLEKTCLSG